MNGNGAGKHFASSRKESGALMLNVKHRYQEIVEMRSV
jgi:hypothetical protein